MQGTQRKGTRISTPAVINIYFNTKRKLSIDSIMKGEVKTLKKGKEKNNSKQSKNTQGRFISEM